MQTPPDSPDSAVPLLTPEELEAMRQAFNAMTRRQREVVLLFGTGARPADIARTLALSKQTVSFHLKSVMRKLGLRDRRELLVHSVLLRKLAKDSEAHSSGEVS